MKSHGTKTRYPCRWFLDCVESVGSLDAEESLPSHCVSLPKILITPTRVFSVGFEVETSNRAIRLFHNSLGFPIESFARVQVVDEDMSSIFPRDLTEPIESRLKELLNGIEIAGKNFTFLAYSPSQLREASVWMVSLPLRTNVVDLRSKLGTITEKTASKYAARLGQCFSTTFCESQMSPEVSTATRYRDETVLDIKADNGCHSDGTGLISRIAMNRVLASLPFAPEDPLDVGIIQIRFKGAKGTLVAWDKPSDLVQCRSTTEVVLRKSMIKFSSPHNEMEVCSIGNRVPYHLNRNVVFLMHSLGVPRRVFVDLQREMLDMLDKVLESNAAALSILPRLSGIDSLQKAMLLHMLHAGLSPAIDPFLYSTLSSIRCHHLFDLRKKSRILVEKGAVLTGGLDETGLLDEGTVFIQLRDDSGEEKVQYKPLVGPVVICKHPVMHQGDIRMLLAVDEPDLRHCRNVLLFSKKGSRPEADKMAGSDLDGDEYAVTWDERLFLGEWNSAIRHDGSRFRSADSLGMLNATAETLQTVNATPMDFSDGKKNTNEISDDPNELSEALIGHFVAYIKNASVGQICGLWWDYASMYGPICEVCIELAKLHSIAVDYPKSGVPAAIPQAFYWKDRPRAHWREKSGASFHCESVVGQLYDAVIARIESVQCNHNVVALAGRKMDKYGTILCNTARNGLTNRRESHYYQPWISEKLGFDSDVLLLDMAIYQRTLYNEDLLQLMNTHGVRAEGEVYTGCIRKYHRLHKKRQHEFSQDIRRRYGLLRAQHRRLFFCLVSELAEGRNVQDNLCAGNRGYATSNPGEVNSDEGAAEESDSEEEPEDFRTLIHRLITDEDEELDQKLKWAEDVALSTTITRHGDSNESRLKRVAFSLAGAWYEATHNPDSQSEESWTRLFSFPWIVADVIARGVTKS